MELVILVMLFTAFPIPMLIGIALLVVWGFLFSENEEEE